MFFVFHLERAKSNDANNRLEISAGNSNQGLLLIPDESTLSRFVAARLDLPISQSLLDRKFKLSIIKRCWEDQLRLKRKIISCCVLKSTEINVDLTFYLDQDFVSDSDLFMACTILQKQIECIDGRKDRITVPSIAMKKIREKEEAGNF
jgi:hypothetical protein